jgi:hypothetical protein
VYIIFMGPSAVLNAFAEDAQSERLLHGAAVKYYGAAKLQ